MLRSASVAPAVLFVACAAALLYILFGYPILLMVLARQRANAVRRELRYKTVTILMAVRNGEPWIWAKLNSLLALEYPRDLLEIIVVSDGSDDGTDRIVRGYEGRGITLVAAPRGGKARALNSGMPLATGEILFFTDVRQQLAPDSLARIVACFADPSVGVVSGELVMRDHAGVENQNVGLYWRYEKWIRRNLSRLDSILGATGCIYAMRRNLARPLPADTLLDDVYLPLAAFFSGYRVILEEGAFAYDDPTSLRHEFRRKVRTQAGVLQLLRHYPALLSSSNRMLLHFLSHKFGRLFIPYLLIGMAVAAFGLPSPWRGLMLVGQALVYSLALLDIWMPARFRAKRISSPVRTFLTLVAAAFLAPSVLFVPPSAFWPPAAATASASSEPAPAPRARGIAAGR
jgi:biofilm PGA synthesis N-glycosyltransferase PgaC